MLASSTLEAGSPPSPPGPCIIASLQSSVGYGIPASVSINGSNQTLCSVSPGPQLEPELPSVRWIDYWCLYQVNGTTRVCTSLWQGPVVAFLEQPNHWTNEEEYFRYISCHASLAAEMLGVHEREVLNFDQTLTKMYALSTARHQLCSQKIRLVEVFPRSVFPPTNRALAKKFADQQAIFFQQVDQQMRSLVLPSDAIGEVGRDC